MQLLLLDTSMPARNLVRDSSASFFFNSSNVHSSLLASSHGCHGDGDLDVEGQAMKKLAREILKAGSDTNAGGYGSSNIFIKLVPMKDIGKVEISVTPSYPHQSIFKGLVQRFQGKVTISVFFKWEVSQVEFATLEGMTIANNYACFGTANANYSNLSNLPSARPRSPFLHVKLVADIEVNVTVSVVGASLGQKLLEKGAFSDLTILAGNGAKVKAHRSILSVCSPVLEAMLGSGMEETQTGKVDMSDLSEEGVRALLRYVYYGELQKPEENFQVAYDLLYASHKYGLFSLESEIETSLLETDRDDFDVAVAFKMYMFTRNIKSAEELKSKAIQVLKANFDGLELLQEYNDIFEKPSNSKTAKELCRDFALTE